MRAVAFLTHSEFFLTWFRHTKFISEFSIQKFEISRQDFDEKHEIYLRQLFRW